MIEVKRSTSLTFDVHCLYIRFALFSSSPNGLASIPSFPRLNCLSRPVAMTSSIRHSTQVIALGLERIGDVSEDITLVWGHVVGANVRVDRRFVGLR